MSDWSEKGQSERWQRWIEKRLKEDDEKVAESKRELLRELENLIGGLKNGSITPIVDVAIAKPWSIEVNALTGVCRLRVRFRDCKRFSPEPANNP